MRWQAILLGVVASWPVAARAECDAIEMVTYADPAEVSCHTGPEPTLPWVDWGTPRRETTPAAPSITVPVAVHEDLDVEVLGVYDFSEITRFDPWYDIPELDD